ncbi:SGNH/GDSL hydrolase family protein [Allonocardiopsis opalescens]|uniref:Lysophospholipase L1-like esterase n=1 Tax=Allonocardiopsis opalescens TaxID=1144618 RepID=A0A2T0QD86_9ACTN|nr:SGNH/GDSL hydrolase family protein [Allonocardiopsis opalescens]PRY01868.1 lysophospholipase L1-like esterase [Allonocardiopsis opalescens]
MLTAVVFRAARVRRIATATAFGGGGLTLLGAATVGLLFVQALVARRTIGLPTESPPPADGLYGAGGGPEISMVMMGDSIAAGLGVDDGVRTPAGLIAGGLAAVAERPVRLTSLAVVGAESKDLPAQLSTALELRPDLAVIFIGGNDVTHLTRPADSVRYLETAVRELRAAGCTVVVGTCPDLGTIEPLGQPLRSLARRASRQLAAVQTVAVVEAGGRTVSLADLLSADFSANPKIMFGPDRFHPSARGYAQAAAAVLPSVCSALGYGPEFDALPDVREDGGALPVSVAAVEAAEEAGAEVSGASVAGRDRGPRGRWATLMRRRRAPAGPREGDPETSRSPS